MDACFEKYYAIKDFTDQFGKEEKELEIVFNNTIKKVTNGLDTFQFNTSIARMMELFNSIKTYLDTGRNSKIVKDIMKDVVKLIAPEAPHISE